jgi:uncharacterized oligopeptide transporter (OPT) family protein
VPRGGRATARAIALAVAVGALAALSNLYVSLKTGWSLPVMTSAVLVAFGAGRLARVARPRSTSFTRAEIALVAGFASGAGYMAGGGNAAALPALTMLGFAAPSALAMALFWTSAAVLGTLIAPLLQRRLLDRDDLAFPTATAAASLVDSLDNPAPGGDDAPPSVPRATKLLAASGVAGGVAALLRSLLRLPASLAFPASAFGHPLGAFTFGLDTSLVLTAAGALMSSRTALSSLVGGLLTYGVGAPLLVHYGVIAAPSYRSIVTFMVWPGAALLVASAVAELLLDLGLMLTRPKAAPAARPRATLSRPLVAVLGLVAVTAVLIEHLLLGISWFHAGAAIPIAYLLAFVAARAMGETDMVPTKALTPLAQLGFAATGAGVTTCTLAPNLTSSVALHAAESLGTLKMVKLLGTSPRVILVARIAGCTVGAAIVMLGYRALVPDARALPTADLPAPAVLVWKSVAELVGGSGGALPRVTRISIAFGAALGVTLVALERVLPKGARRFVPSAAGLGTGMVLPASSSLGIAVGALVRDGFERRARAQGEAARAAVASFAVAIASGVIAGESLVGVGLHAFAALRAFAG